MRQNRHLRLFTDNSVFHHKILVWNRIGGRNFRHGTRRANALKRYFVIGALDVPNRHTRFERHRKANIMPCAIARFEHWRRDSRGVRYARRVRRPTCAGRIASFHRCLYFANFSRQFFRKFRFLGYRCAGNVAGPDHHREVKFISAHVVVENINVGDFDANLLARFDVADRLGKDIRSLLLKEACRRSLIDRPLIHGTRLSPTLNQTDNPSLADDHCHIVHGGGMRQRENINRLNLFVIRILERLGHRHARDEAGDNRFDICVFQRTFDNLILGFDAQRALGDLLFHRVNRLWCLCEGDAAGKNQYHQRIQSCHSIHLIVFFGDLVVVSLSI